MHVIERILYDRRRRAGRSHAPQFRMRKAVLPDLVMCRLQSLDQRRLRVVAAEVAIDRHQRFHRQKGRFLTTFVAAHAVRHNRQPALAQELPVVLRLPITEGILVVLAQAADVGLARYFDSGANFPSAPTSMAKSESTPL